VCGVYHWRSVLRNIIFQADKVHRSDPNFIVPRGSDVHMWTGWLHTKTGLWHCFFALCGFSSAMIY